MRILNSTTIKTETVRAVLGAVSATQRPIVKLQVRNRRNSVTGRAHCLTREICASIAPDDITAAHFRRGGRGGYLSVQINNRLEALVYVLAHETRHLWQYEPEQKAQITLWRLRRGAAAFERDADTYAIAKLSEYRKGILNLTPAEGGKPWARAV